MALEVTVVCYDERYAGGFALECEALLRVSGSPFRCELLSKRGEKEVALEQQVAWP